MRQNRRNGRDDVGDSGIAIVRAKTQKWQWWWPECKSGNADDKTTGLTMIFCGQKNGKFDSKDARMKMLTSMGHDLLLWCPKHRNNYDIRKNATMAMMTLKVVEWLLWRRILGISECRNGNADGKTTRLTMIFYSKKIGKFDSKDARMKMLTSMGNDLLLWCPKHRNNYDISKNATMAMMTLNVVEWLLWRRISGKNKNDAEDARRAKMQNLQRWQRRHRNHYGEDDLAGMAGLTAIMHEWLLWRQKMMSDFDDWKNAGRTMMTKKTRDWDGW